MNSDCFWTKSHARLQLAKTYSEKNIHWLFLPGGPGLGSEYLVDLVNCLDLPGKAWYLDLPGDGSNTTTNDDAFSQWYLGLLEACQSLPNVILVAHSSGGMFALATPELENYLKGLILLNSAPNARWQSHFTQFIHQNLNEDVLKWQAIFEENPSNNTFKQLTISSAPLFSTPASLKKIQSRLELLPFNYKTYLWAKNYFHPHYKANWIPRTLSTGILSGSEDYLTPITLFTNEPAFHRKNISIREIQGAAHFPWLEKPNEIKKFFSDFCQSLPWDKFS